MVAVFDRWLHGLCMGCWAFVQDFCILAVIGRWLLCSGGCVGFTE